MSPQGTPSQNTITTITDTYGNVILEVRQEEYVVIGKDGSITSYANYRYMQLVCGTAWNPAMMLAKPPVLVGVCGICRQPSLFRRRSHGLVALARARYCECGTLCCPRHRTLCSDQKWRCPACTRKYRAKNLIRPLFFKKIGE